MRVLVAYGSKKGGTKGLAEAIGEGIEESGLTVDVMPADRIDGLEEWDAVVIGGALYAWMWHRDARGFLKHHRRQLREMPVWVFSSGPLDESAEEREIPPVGRLGSWMNKIEAKAHKTFGGRITAEQRNELPAGDWRNMDDARQWGREIAEAVQEAGPRDGPLPELETRRERRFRSTAAALCMFTGLTAMFGGGALILSPTGGASLGLPMSMLEGTPFNTYLIPGFLLFFVVGVSNLFAGVRLIRRLASADMYAVAAGGILAIWLVTQMVMLNTVAFLHVLYMVVAVATMGAAFGAWWQRHREDGRQPGELAQGE